MEIEIEMEVEIDFGLEGGGGRRASSTRGRETLINCSTICSFALADSFNNDANTVEYDSSYSTLDYNNMCVCLYVCVCECKYIYII